ncbi:fe(2+) transport protein 3, chloroplastic-like [Cyclospora cayetanensis]|uniref:Fe(2+) transport protein 3, chloroplastic-like n=1 Tax=Cyclospora cayetanensis TaxID=88456 RepID=A0A6P6S1S6_9EIME|nr:fe(2+) transport protein 3, chloroplastic-like [Cyclospora cayetanensis]
MKLIAAALIFLCAVVGAVPAFVVLRRQQQQQHQQTNLLCAGRRGTCTAIPSCCGSNYGAAGSACCFGASPFYVRAATVYTAGIVAAVSLLHLLPAAERQLSEIMETDDFEGRQGSRQKATLYPAGPLCCLIGLLLSAALEAVVEQMQEQPQRDGEARVSCDSLSVFSHSKEEAFSPSVPVPLQPAGARNACPQTVHTQLRHSRGTAAPSSAPASSVADGEKRASFWCEEDVGGAEAASYGEADLNTELIGGCSQSLRRLGGPSDLPTNSPRVSAGPPSVANSKAFFLGSLLLAGLSVHSVMEGLTLGAAPNPATIALAILLHKTLEAFAVGSSLLHVRVSLRSYVFQMLLYALTAPIGVAGGLFFLYGSQGSLSGAGREGKSSSPYLRLIPGVITGLGAGAFLHVGLLEILASELQRCRRERRQDLLPMISLTAFGALCMAVV